ncbi:hypothetical protein BU15DRAFT_64279 [Melanogaster broomeanus]|nr:hypothetical protein BU15DRAFT_64279 [Melanogaster broomeanus]
MLELSPGKSVESKFVRKKSASVTGAKLLHDQIVGISKTIVPVIPVVPLSDVNPSPTRISFHFHMIDNVLLIRYVIHTSDIVSPFECTTEFSVLVQTCTVDLKLKQMRNTPKYYKGGPLSIEHSPLPPDATGTNSGLVTVKARTHEGNSSGPTSPIPCNGLSSGTISSTRGIGVGSEIIDLGGQQRVMHCRADTAGDALTVAAPRKTAPRKTATRMEDMEIECTWLQTCPGDVTRFLLAAGLHVNTATVDRSISGKVKRNSQFRLACTNTWCFGDNTRRGQADSVAVIPRKDSYSKVEFHRKWPQRERSKLLIEYSNAVEESTTSIVIMLLVLLAKASRIWSASGKEVPWLYEELELATVDSLITHTPRFAPWSMGYEGVWGLWEIGNVGYLAKWWNRLRGANGEGVLGVVWVMGYGLWLQIHCKPTWEIQKCMGYEGVWVIWGMGYEGVDYVEERRFFSPTEIWTKYGFEEMKVLYEKGDVDIKRKGPGRSPSCIAYLYDYGYPGAVFYEPKMFQRNIKIRKLEAVQMPLFSERTPGRYMWIQANAKPPDPNFFQISVMLQGKGENGVMHESSDKGSAVAKSEEKKCLNLPRRDRRCSLGDRRPTSLVLSFWL